MKKLKLFILLICIFLLCGCTIQYDITIDEQLGMEESMVISEKSEFYQDYLFSTPKEVSEMILGVYQEELDSLNYQYSIEATGKTTLTNHYNSYLTYVNDNRIFNQFFEKILSSENGNIITIYNEGEFYPYTEGNPNYFQVEEININVKLPFKVLENNADKVDKKNNIYTWTITKETENKTFLLKFDKSKKSFTFTQMVNLIVISIFVLLIGGLGFSFFWIYNRYQKMSHWN